MTNLQVLVDNTSPGSVLELPGDVYPGGVVIAKPLTMCAREGEHVVIAAPTESNEVAHTNCVWVRSPGVVLSDLEIMGGRYMGVKFDYSYGELHRCHVHHTGAHCVKIVPGVHNVVVHRCHLHHPGNLIGPGIGVDMVGGDKTTVMDTYVHDCAGVGVMLKGGAWGACVTRCLIERVMIGITLGQYTDREWFDTDQNPGRWELVDSYATSNIIRDTRGAGIAFYASLRCKALHNTLVECAQNYQAAVLLAPSNDYGKPELGEKGNEEPTIANNIVLSPTNEETATLQIAPYGIKPPSQGGHMTLRSNIWHRVNPDGGGKYALFWDSSEDPDQCEVWDLNHWSAAWGEEGSQDANPLLFNRACIGVDSPAYGAGWGCPTLAASVDYNGNPRGDRIDVGAAQVLGRRVPPAPDAPGTY